MIAVLSGLLCVAGLMVAVLYQIAKENEQRHASARVENDRLRALLKTQAAANDLLRERVKHLHWERSSIWRYIAEGDDAAA